MQLIIACFTEAPHNPVAAFMVAYMVGTTALVIFSVVNHVTRRR